jgi:hypothetical protein
MKTSLRVSRKSIPQCDPAKGGTPEQKFRNAVHELGHVWGLEHDPIGASVMYPYDVGTYKVLMKPELAALEKRHALRPGVSREMVVVSGHCARERPRGTEG